MFEYETRRSNDRKIITEVINDMAKKGWRAVGFTCDNAYFYALLERRIVEDVSE